MPLAALNDLKLPEHVLVEGIVDVQLHPVQSGDAFGEVLRKVSKQPRGIGLFHFSFGDHFRDHGVGPAALFGIERWAHGLVPMGQTFGKKAQIE
jgi:hypothetical protein